MYIVDTLYDALGHTGNSYYVRFVEADTGQIWDDTNEELATDPAWLDSSIMLAETGTTGQFPVVAPEKLPKGHRYDYIVYTMAASSPTNTDDVTKQSSLTLGDMFGF
jgi:hypothetical protein